MKFPPSGLEEIMSAYGDPRPFIENKPAWEAAVLEYFDLPYPLRFCGEPVRRIRAHKRAGLFFIAAFTQILERGLTDHAREYGGIYNFRQSRTSQRLSTHSWGIAIDLNPSANELGAEPRQHPEIVDIFERLGFKWGGRFTGRKDGMHFQLARGY